jgi:hypothetical protein
MGLGVRLVGIRELWSRLGAEPVEQAVTTPQRCGRTRLQDSENGTILIVSFHKFCISNLFILLNSVLQKASTGVDPHCLDVFAACTSRQHRHN